MTKKEIDDNMNQYELNPEDGKWYHVDTHIPQDLMPYADLFRKDSKRSARKLFKQIFFDRVKSDFLATSIQNPNDVPPQELARINNMALSNMFREFVVDVAINGAGINSADTYRIGA